MSTREASRRSFLLESVTGLGAAWVTANYAGILAAEEYVLQAAQSNAVKFQFFTPEQAAEIEAMAAQIIPTDETPGRARSAGDQLHRPGAVTFEKDSQPAYTQGLKDSRHRRNSCSRRASKFSALTAPQQIQVLTAMEKSPFFNRSGPTRSPDSLPAPCTAAIRTRSAGSW